MEIPTTSESQRYLGYYIDICGVNKTVMFEKKKKQIASKMGHLRSLGVFKHGLPLSISTTLMTAHLTPLIDFGFQCIQYTKLQHKQLQTIIKKHVKRVIGAKMTIPNSLLDLIAKMPNTKDRNDYLNKKQRVHYGWRFYIDNTNVNFHRTNGSFKFHPYLLQNPKSMTAKLLTWDFKPNARSNDCRTCHNSHSYLYARLKCFATHHNLLDNLPNQPSNDQGNSKTNENEYPNDNIQENITVVACDASISNNKIGIGLIVKNATNEITDEISYTVLENTNKKPSSTEVELLGIKKSLDYLIQNEIENGLIICDNIGAVKIFNYLKNKQNDPSKHALGYHLNYLQNYDIPGISAKWVKGHNGNAMNERSDYLAKHADNRNRLYMQSIAYSKSKLQNYLHLFDKKVNLDLLNSNQENILNNRIRAFKNHFNLH
eukprot:NODE_266_length_11332_cov_0.554705.p3 type:complete len:430 gc:universal NODE_266_length_11332_cov_0.554705:9975-11264(+)